MIRTLPLGFVLLSVLCFSACGGGGGGANGGVDPTNAPAAGPIDGTWKVSGALCNGVTATGTATTAYTAPYSSIYVITNTGGTASATISSCTATSSLTVSYPTSTSAVITSVGNWSCNPAGCAGATVCGNPVASVPLTYKYTLTGSELALMPAGTSDTTCSSATPVQSNPVTHLFTRQ